jgi:deoxyribodipyrimidine photolyase
LLISPIEQESLGREYSERIVDHHEERQLALDASGPVLGK